MKSQLKPSSSTTICEAGYRFFVTVLGEEKAAKIQAACEDIQDLDSRANLVLSMVEDLKTLSIGGTPRQIKDALAVTHKPVGIRQFVEDPYFMNARGIIYPRVLECMEEMNSGEYQEAVLTGAIGTGKSTIALYSTAYQLYLLSCYKNPHKVFGLDPSSELIFVFQSINARLAKAVDFDRFQSMIEKSPYFRDKFRFNPDIKSELKFPHRIIVKPISGSETAALGQNVFGGMIDEVNFMSLTQHSKSAVDGGTYDQAVALYNSIARRRKSRFMVMGKVPGLLCLVSSKRYPGQFTDQKVAEAQKELARNGKTTIYVYDKKVWEIKPEGSFTGEWFEVFIGDEWRKPRLLEVGERVPTKDEALVVSIPVEYRHEFETDIINSLRDIAGVSTLATHPFIMDRATIADAMRDANQLFSREATDFQEKPVSIYKGALIDMSLPRFVHVDLALTGDSAGFCVGTVTGFSNVQTSHGIEMLPKIWIDGILEIQPPRGAEILFYKIRDLIYALKNMGLNIRWVTFDQYQSADTIQVLRQAGFIMGRLSMDMTTVPYDFLKGALYERRLSVPRTAKLAYELASLEKDVRRNKIDHPPKGSKDLSDALAGVVYGLTTRREVWAKYGVPVGEIPQSIKQLLQSKSEASSARR